MHQFGFVATETGGEMQGIPEVGVDLSLQQSLGGIGSGTGIGSMHH